MTAEATPSTRHPGPLAVDVWLDPACPYTWLTSRWLLEAARVRPLDLRRHLMSLALLNEGRDDDPEGDPTGYLMVPVRIGTAVLHHHGQQALARFHAALWADRGSAGRTRRWINDPAAALADAGLPAGLAAVGGSTAYDGILRASHAEAVRLLGPRPGTPVVAVTDPAERDRGPLAFFGPVLSRVPRGEEAGRLWDGTLLVAGAPGFHELKGPPADPDPDVGGWDDPT
ncbi:disulfide bond formation protein DsbA [Streptomyces sp. C10-9-1]|uniref:mycothiol-dependent nitroreductase Rv2466c family protein n=1 Tax=Streptomyces sp. C10-9-1 TaxID=1859285 RepID=UPI0021136E40|nr:disulfide bond formation protein DsbA [Streptomyces sp. C10-9-1]MCQ6556750.1 disulfide bond formation protein DsbA [Streptomyces sp. C10-9-1]